MDNSHANGKSSGATGSMNNGAANRTGNGSAGPEARPATRPTNSASGHEKTGESYNGGNGHAPATKVSSAPPAHGHAAAGSLLRPPQPAPRAPLGAPAGDHRRYAQIVGWGMHVPDKIITNKDLEQIVDTTDDWIRDRTGIEERHVAADPRETSATLGAAAARKALDMADIPAARVNLIICATSSPEHLFPSTGSVIQDLIGADNAGAFDLSAACSGFVYALSLARGMILAGDMEYVLVIGTETLSRIVDWTDRGTCVLFGDGAGAV
ncbi:MAG: hypothetical protein ACRC1H_06700, partial [Caldilineaceae bacterium]